MRKKNTKNKDSKKLQRELDDKSWFDDLSIEVKHGVVALIFIALTIFFAISPIGFAGVVGDKVYESLNKLFGIGYFVIPLLFLMLSISFLKDSKPNLAIQTSIGSVLFVISTLGIVGIFARPETSGILGNTIASPIQSLFGNFMSFVFLALLLIISLFIFFNKIPNKDSFKFNKNKEEETVKEMEIKISKSENENSNDTTLETKKEYEKMQQPEKQNITTSKIKDAINHIKLPSKNISETHLNSMEEFVSPPINLLSLDSGKPVVGDIKEKATIIKRTLRNFGINVEMDEVSVGPSVTRYSLKPAEGVKLSRIMALQSNLALALATHPVRIEAPIPGRSLVGIEIPNTIKTTVGLGSLIKKDKYQDSSKPLLMAMGKNIEGKAFYSNLAKVPHLLIAGTTGSGKSVTVHALIQSLLYRNAPENLQFIMVDPKRVELTLYNGIPHLLTPVITDPKNTIKALHWAISEMERRYDILESEKVRDIQSYHKNIYEPVIKKFKSEHNTKVKNNTDAIGPTEEGTKIPEQLPYIVVVIDELADIMMAYPKELEAGIVRLAQMSRAIGIHLIISTQRPSVNIITGLIKANIPGRAALQVSSQIDSRTILDSSGAEKLLGAGDMLYVSSELTHPVRLQSPFVSEKEIKNVVQYFTKRYENRLPNEIDLDSVNKDKSIFSDEVSGSSGNDDEDDEIYELARQTVIESGKASTSFLQRRLKLGYSRAARIIDVLEERGVVGPPNGSKPREVYEQNAEEVMTDNFESDISEPEIPETVSESITKPEINTETKNEEKDESESDYAHIKIDDIDESINADVKDELETSFEDEKIEKSDVLDPELDEKNEVVETTEKEVETVDGIDTRYIK